jgi:NAD(P)-dependent dehydrogenase (short-subunit alcohol dehydrogenase family)
MTIDLELEGKVVAVTGGFGSLGTAVVKAAIAAGARVVAIDQAPAPSRADALAGAMLLGGVDLTSLSAAQKAFARIVDELDRLDALVNIAGTFRWEPEEGTGLETWDLLYNVNLKTAVAASKAALPHLVRSGDGRIVNIGSASSAKGGTGMGAYSASKSGVARLTESLAEELEDRGVLVNAVLPATMDTPPNRADMPKADFTRWVKPEAVASVIVFLLSRDARAVTGALIPVVGRAA